MSAQTLPFLQKLVPTNLEEEKRKFFFDTKYNPQFEYPENIDLDEWQKHGPIDTELIPMAQSILDGIIRKWGNESTYLHGTEGRVLTRDEVENTVGNYLDANQLRHLVNVNFTPSITARTSMHKNTLNIRLPVQYREHGIIGTLNHEIGTHFLRRLNDEKQPWHKNRSEFDMRPALITEEGLAVINGQYGEEEKGLWFPALGYYAVYLAEKMSFSQLFAELRKYSDDKDRRWSLCMKVKRGIKDTSIPGSFSKNQVYLRGVMVVLRWYLANGQDLRELYYGKVAIEDLEHVRSISMLKPEELVVPEHVQHPKIFLQDIRKMISANKLATYL